MLNRLKESISYVSLPNIHHVDIRDEPDLFKKASFDTFADLMEDVIETEEKSSVEAFLPVRFKPQEEWVQNSHGNERIDENVLEVTMAVIDLDKPGAREKAEEVFKDHEYIIHSTHSYTKETPYKYRMILKLEHPIPVSEWKPFFYKMVLPIDGDTSCSNVSRGYYMASHSPSAGIDPYFDHNPGKALTLDFVNKLSKQNVKDLAHSENEKDKEKLRLYQYRINPESKPSGKVDPFSGKIVNDNVVSSRVDCTYEAYCKRHKDLITEELQQNDNRHNFALRAIYNEFLENKDLVDIPSLVMFMHRAAYENSSKALHLGDTPRELPHLVESALDRLKNVTKPASEFTGKLRAANQKAKAMCIQVMATSDTSNWKFPAKPKRPERVKKNLLAADDKDLSVRFKDEIEKYRSDKNWRGFAEAVLSSADLDDGAQVYDYARFVLQVTDETYRDVMKRTIQKEKFENLLADFQRTFSGDNEKLRKGLAFGFNSYKKEMKQLTSDAPSQPKRKHESGGLNP